MVYLDFNTLSSIEFPQVFLCHRNTKLKNGVKTIQRYGELYPIIDLSIKLYLNSPDEIQFTVPRYVDGKETPLWEDITDLKVVQIPKFGNFEIAVVRLDDGIVEKKIVSGKSLEVELGQLYLNDFEANTLGQIEGDEDWIPIQFYKPTDPAHSLLHLATLKAPAWSIGHVDAELWTKQRTYDVDGVAIYDFLTGDVAEQLECIFLFDTFNRVINCFSLSTYGEDTTIYISKENLMSELNIEADKDQIKNCFKVVGGDYVNIANVNPNGTDYLWMLTEHDKKDMSPELVSRLAEYDGIYNSYKENYEKIMAKIKTGYDAAAHLVNKVSESTEPEKNLTTCGLVQLESLQQSYQNIEDLYITVGFGKTSSSEYQRRYLPNHNLILAIKAEIKVRESQIEAEKAKVASYIQERDNIQKVLDLETFLTKANNDKSLWLELSMYRREEIYENSNYSGTDNSTDDQLFELERALYEDAEKELIRASTPRYTFQVEMNNILANEYFKNRDIDRFKLGNFIRVGINDKEVAKVRLIEIEMDFNNLQDITVAFSETINRGGIYSDAQSILNQASSAATSYQTVKKQYDSAKNKIDFVTQMKKEGLNAALVAIKNSGSQTTVFDEHGILCRQWNDQKQDYEPEQLKIINNLIAYTDDNWHSVRQAIGKIQFNGENVYGVIADALVGNIIAGNNLIITNQNNSFVVDETGATLTDASFKIKKDDILIELSPDKGIEITNDGNKVFYVDEKGNVRFAPLDESNQNLQTQIDITAEGLTAEIKRATDTENEMATKITATAEGLSSEITRAKGVEKNISDKVTTTEVNLNSKIEQTARDINLSVDKQVIETKKYADTQALNAKNAANSTTDDKLKSYTTTIDMKSEINMSAEQIRSEVKANYVTQTAAGDAYSDIYTAIDQTASGIISTATKTYATKDEVNTLSSVVSQTAEAIDLKVAKGTIISEINLSNERATIQSSKINLNGYTSINGNFNVDTNGNLTIGQLSNGSYNTKSGKIYLGLTGDTTSGTLRLRNSNGDLIAITANQISFKNKDDKPLSTKWTQMIEADSTWGFQGRFDYLRAETFRVSRICVPDWASGQVIWFDSPADFDYAVDFNGNVSFTGEKVVFGGGAGINQTVTFNDRPIFNEGANFDEDIRITVNKQSIYVKSAIDSLRTRVSTLEQAGSGSIDIGAYLSSNGYIPASKINAEHVTSIAWLKSNLIGVANQVGYTLK